MSYTDSKANLTTDATTKTTTGSKRWQPPPVHPDRASSTTKLGTTATTDFDAKGSETMKGEEHFDYGTANTKKNNDTALPTNVADKSAANQSNIKRPSTPSRRLFSAYARTMVGLNPLWLAAEAISSSRKPFSQFNRGRKELVDVIGELSGGRDVVVVVDEKIRALGRGFGKGKEGDADAEGEKGGAREIAERTAEVVRAAGENALLVVTSSLSSLQSSLSSSSSSSDRQTPSDGNGINLEPTLAALKEHISQAKDSVDTRAALLLLDRSLKHPVLVAGVREFAQTRGIPHADAVLRLASLGVSRLLRKFPETEAAATAVGEAAQRNEEVRIEEVTAEELERSASPAERAEAERVGRAGRDAGEGSANLKKARAQRVESLDEQPEVDPYEAMRKKTASECVVQ
ncbi:hypothetical protein SCHPADRAFT_889800 [Schizopora paradoxa]|uniref:Uncharacterized protein n=1 Tax=Schizopora paradoxa TaxID=27342 RepID=A0A0H2RP98_9AGAM|nr:hypothetical protein SCHPADRAFT_889800 [Schizopora paradoxa]